MSKTETNLENELIQKMADSELAVLINSMNELRKSIQAEPTAAKNCDDGKAQGGNR